MTSINEYEIIDGKETEIIDYLSEHLMPGIDIERYYWGMRERNRVRVVERAGHYEVQFEIPGNDSRGGNPDSVTI